MTIQDVNNQECIVVQCKTKEDGLLALETFPKFLKKERTLHGYDYYFILDDDL